MTNRVETGLERLLSERRELIVKRRVGLLANQTSVTRDMLPSWQLLAEDPDIDLAVIFTPEHGLSGIHQDMDPVKEELFGSIPVVSLYGEDESSLRPSRDLLRDIDCLVYDIQDIGSRYYTFLATLSMAMEEAGRADVEVIVCDRPNPINALDVEGGIVEPGYRSFVGWQPLSARHGLTAAEASLFFQRFSSIDCRLTIVEMAGYRRSLWFDETGLPFVPPSPNMPTLSTATIYPGGCLFEGTNLSEGRGTTLPFELVGAPYIDGARLRQRLVGCRLPGVAFRPAAFRPMFQKWAGERCEGVQIHVTDRSAFRPLLTGIALIRAVLAEWPKEFAYRTEPYEFVTDRLAIDLLFGNDRLRPMIEAQTALDEIAHSFELERAQFLEKREAVLIYE